MTSATRASIPRRVGSGDRFGRWVRRRASSRRSLRFVSSTGPQPGTDRFIPRLVPGEVTLCGSIRRFLDADKPSPQTDDACDAADRLHEQPGVAVRNEGTTQNETRGRQNDDRCANGLHFVLDLLSCNSPRMTGTGRTVSSCRFRQATTFRWMRFSFRVHFRGVVPGVCDQSSLSPATFAGRMHRPLSSLQAVGSSLICIRSPSVKTVFSPLDVEWDQTTKEPAAFHVAGTLRVPTAVGRRNDNQGSPGCSPTWADEVGTRHTRASRRRPGLRERVGWVRCRRTQQCPKPSSRHLAGIRLRLFQPTTTTRLYPCPSVKSVVFHLDVEWKGTTKDTKSTKEPAAFHVAGTLRVPTAVGRRNDNQGSPGCSPTWADEVGTRHTRASRRRPGLRERVGWVRCRRTQQCPKPSSRHLAGRRLRSSQPAYHRSSMLKLMTRQEQRSLTVAAPNLHPSPSVKSVVSLLDVDGDETTKDMSKPRSEQRRNAARVHCEVNGDYAWPSLLTRSRHTSRTGITSTNRDCAVNSPKRFAHV